MGGLGQMWSSGLTEPTHVKNKKQQQQKKKKKKNG